MLKKIVQAGDDRRSRFHTEENVFIGWSSVFTEAPIVFAQKMHTKITGSRPVAPWWPLPAITQVEKRLKPNMRAIEFGSGSSSVWIGKRVSSLVCREHDKAWADITRKRVETEGVVNCDVQHRTGESYFSLEPDDRFDFAVVDGEYRWKCLEALSEKMSRGGLIYFDNSDSDKDAKHYKDFGLQGKKYAQAVIRDLAKIKGVHIEEFSGMIHGELYAGSGMLITLP